MTTPAIHIVGISGSLRKKSYNTALLNAAQKLLPEGTTFETASIGDLPLFNTDMDGEAQSEAVKKFRGKLAKADAFVFVSPEYNYSVPGVLKNAIDWASRGGKDSPLVNKPVALMGATNGLWGTARMQQAFRPIFQSMNMFPVNKPEVYVSQAMTKFDDQGNLIDEKTADVVKKQLSALKELTHQLKK